MTSIDIKNRRNLSFNEDVDIESGSLQNLLHKPVRTEVKGMTQLAFVFILVVLWYSAAIIAITSSKILLTKLSFPYFLCCTQFMTASISTHIYLSYNAKFKTLPVSYHTYIRLVGISYTLGFIFTNLSFSLGELYVYINLLIFLTIISI